jgi:uncharacterized DUF497 family protein
VGEDLNFEYDENKSKINKQKHGIDFEEIKSIFFQLDLKVYKANTIDNEERLMTSGFIDGKCWTVVFVIRKENIRLISARRCRKKEEKRVEK